MTYWYDPFHFTLEMGRMMQLSLLGQAPSDLPENFMIRLTPDTVAAHIDERREAIRAWGEANPAIAEAIRTEYTLWKNGGDAPTDAEASGSTAPTVATPPPPPTPAPTTPPTDIRPQFAGAVELATLEGGFIRIAGWAANIPRNEPAPYVLVTDGDRILAVVEPSLERPVIRDNLASNADPAGFEVAFEAPQGEAGTGAPAGGLKVYAIFWNGAAARLNVSLPGEAGALFERYAAGG